VVATLACPFTPIPQNTGAYEDMRVNTKRCEHCYNLATDGPDWVRGVLWKEVPDVRARARYSPTL
jgi:hypothetical protein